MARRNHGKPDPLQVQIALKIRAPKGSKISPRVLRQIMDRVAAGDELPSTVEFRGIFWRNPNRRGDLSHWRYHEGADLSAAPTSAPLESSPRGSLQWAIETLSPYLETGDIVLS